jgi:hypothetical protein
MFFAARNRMGGPQLLVLFDPDDILGIGELLFNLLRREANHNMDLCDADFPAGVEHIG